MSANDRSDDHGRPPPLWFLRGFSHFHVLLYRLSRFIGDPSCLVTMTGARSGRPRTIPLMYIPHGDSVLLVASQGGAPTHPAWYYNLVANPEIVVEKNGRRRKLRARLLTADEKAELWPICVERYAGYDEYQKRTPRDIPVFLCEP